MINRRYLLELLISVSGAGTAAILLGSCSHNTNNKVADTSSLLTPHQLETLRHICMQTIPSTDTPGAAEVNCHQFIDQQLEVVFNELDQQKSMMLLDKIRSVSNLFGAAAFEYLSPHKQLLLLQDLEAAKDPFGCADLQAFKLLKGLIVFGYYTSEEGATQELNYVAMPDGFKGSVPLSRIKSAYSSKAYY